MRAITRKLIIVMLTALTLFSCVIILSSHTSQVNANSGTNNTFQMVSGASIRVGSNNGTNGIRFQVRVGDAKYQQVKENPNQSFGMLIMPYGFYSQKVANGSFTGEYHNDFTPEQYAEGSLTAFEADPDVKTAMMTCGVLYGIKDENIKLKYLAVAYVKTVDPDNQDNVSYEYATFDGDISTNYSRSIHAVAKMALSDTVKNYSDRIKQDLCDYLIRANDILNAPSETAVGQGTESDPYIICTQGQLEKLRDTVNAGTNNYAGKYFAIAQDMTFTGSSIGSAFAGNINGWNNTVKVAVGSPLFNTTEMNATMSNLTVTGNNNETCTVKPIKVHMSTTGGATVLLDNGGTETIKNVILSDTTNAEYVDGVVKAKVANQSVKATVVTDNFVIPTTIQTFEDCGTLSVLDRTTAFTDYVVGSQINYETKTSLSKMGNWKVDYGSLTGVNVDIANKTVTASAGATTGIHSIKAYYSEFEGEKLNETTFNVQVNNFNTGTYATDKERLESCSGVFALNEADTAYLGNLKRLWATSANENTTAFIGDSFFDERGFWTDFYTDYADSNVITLGIGGTTSMQWENIIYKQDVFGDKAPKNIVVNIGNNNVYMPETNADNPDWIYRGETQTLLDIERLLVLLHSKYPNAKIYWFDVVLRSGVWRESEILNVNANARGWCALNNSWAKSIAVDNDINNVQYDAVSAKTGQLRDGTHVLLEVYDTHYKARLNEALIATGSQISDGSVFNTTVKDGDTTWTSWKDMKPYESAPDQMRYNFQAKVRDNGLYIKAVQYTNNVLETISGPSWTADTHIEFTLSQHNVGYGMGGTYFAVWPSGNIYCNNYANFSGQVVKTTIRDRDASKDFNDDYMETYSKVVEYEIFLQFSNNIENPTDGPYAYLKMRTLTPKATGGYVNSAIENRDGNRDLYTINCTSYEYRLASDGSDLVYRDAGSVGNAMVGPDTNRYKYQAVKVDNGIHIRMEQTVDKAQYKAGTNSNEGWTNATHIEFRIWSADFGFGAGGTYFAVWTDGTMYCNNATNLNTYVAKVSVIDQGETYRIVYRVFLKYAPLDGTALADATMFIASCTPGQDTGYTNSKKIHQDGSRYIYSVSENSDTQQYTLTSTGLTA